MMHMHQPGRDLSSTRVPYEIKAGWPKIQGCCRKALQLGYECLWLDTCCIDN
jgi:hypothetical protein